MERWCRFHEKLEERGMDSYFTFFLFIGEIERESGRIIPGSFSNSPYSDKETVEFLELLGTEHQWGFGIEEVIPDDVAKALMQTLELEA